MSTIDFQALHAALDRLSENDVDRTVLRTAKDFAASADKRAADPKGFAHAMELLAEQLQKATDRERNQRQWAGVGYVFVRDYEQSRRQVQQAERDMDDAFNPFKGWW